MIRSTSALTTPEAIDFLEHQHRITDLYYNLARKFQPGESTLKYILKKKRICSERIINIRIYEGEMG